MRLVRLYDVNSFSDLGGIYLRVRWVEKCMGMYVWIYIMDGSTIWMGSTLWMENNVNTKSVFSMLSV